MPALTLIVFLPIVASLLAFGIGGYAPRLMRRISILLSLGPLAILVSHASQWQGVSLTYHWLPQLSIDFYLAVDGLSLLFLYLTALLIPIALFTLDLKSMQFPQVFVGLILLLQGLLSIFFLARDLILFVICWEAMLLPLYVIIHLWGGQHGRRASLLFLIYMIAGSTFMIAAVLALFFGSPQATFNMDVLQKIASQLPYAPWIFAAFLLAFAVKTPLFPFHGWLPQAYCEAPMVGSILLSALLSKAGIYGIARIGLGFFPGLMAEWSPLLLAFAIAGVFYGGFAAWAQGDFKRVIAYSSLSHVNFILVGLFALNQTARDGAILQAFNHGIAITGLFLTAGWLENRLTSTSIGMAHGLASSCPRLCWLTLLFVLCSVALPGMNTFIGEFMILFGLFTYHPWLASILALSIVLSVIYMLHWMQSVYFGKPGAHAGWSDIGWREALSALPLVLAIFWIGIYPAPLLKLLQPKPEQTVAFSSVEESE